MVGIHPLSTTIPVVNQNGGIEWCLEFLLSFNSEKVGTTDWSGKINILKGGVFMTLWWNNNELFHQEPNPQGFRWYPSENLPYMVNPFKTPSRYHWDLSDISLKNYLIWQFSVYEGDDGTVNVHMEKKILQSKFNAEGIDKLPDIKIWGRLPLFNLGTMITWLLGFDPY